MLEKAVRIRTVIEAGGRIEIHAPDVPPGKTVEVIILLAETHPRGRRSAIEILAAAPSTAVTTAEDVDRYLQSERDAWDNEASLLLDRCILIPMHSSRVLSILNALPHPSSHSGRPRTPASS